MDELQTVLVQVQDPPARGAALAALRGDLSGAEIRAPDERGVVEIGLAAPDVEAAIERVAATAARLGIEERVTVLRNRHDP
jgi:hypothetical protein